MPRNLLDKLDDYDLIKYQLLNEEVLDDDPTKMTAEMKRLFDYIIETNKKIEESKQKTQPKQKKDQSSKELRKSKQKPLSRQNLNIGLNRDKSQNNVFSDFSESTPATKTLKIEDQGSGSFSDIIRSK